MAYSLNGEDVLHGQVQDDAFQKLTGVEDGLASRICCHCKGNAAVVVVAYWCSARFLPLLLTSSSVARLGTLTLFFVRHPGAFAAARLPGAMMAIGFDEGTVVEMFWEMGDAQTRGFRIICGLFGSS
jgi:hypothetical protein